MEIDISFRAAREELVRALGSRAAEAVGVVVALPRGESRTQARVYSGYGEEAYLDG